MRRRSWLLPIILFVALLVFAFFAPDDVKLGNLGEWAGAMGGLGASSVALYVAGASRREGYRLEQLRRDQGLWERASELGVELWVLVDRHLAGHELEDSDQKRTQILINALMATADHSPDADLGDYANFLCRAVWQPLVAVSEKTESQADLEKLTSGLANRQDFLSIVNAVVDMKSLDPIVELSDRKLVQVVEEANTGLDWDC